MGETFPHKSKSPEQRTDYIISIRETHSGPTIDLGAVDFDPSNKFSDTTDQASSTGGIRETGQLRVKKDFWNNPWTIAVIVGLILLLIPAAIKTVREFAEIETTLDYHEKQILVINQTLEKINDSINEINNNANKLFFRLENLEENIDDE